MSYAELHVTTNYSFLRGASHPEELFAQAAAYGMAALGVADHDTVAGMVRAWDAARTTKVRLVAGCRIGLRCGTSMLAYPTDLPAWSRLCQLLTLGRSRHGHGTFDLGWDDLADACAGFVLVLLPDDAFALPQQLARLRAEAKGRSYVAGAVHRRPGDALRLHRLAELGRAAGVPMVATGNVLFHHPERRILQDVVTCIREGCTIDAAGFKRERHADRHLKPPGEMARLFARHPDAVARTGEIVERCRFDLGDLRYQYPEEADDPGQTPQQALEQLTWAGATWRYPEGVPDKAAAQLRHELRLIGELQYAPYFLTVHSIVRYARGQGILCQGRGSAANSAVCWVLGITSVDPTAKGLLFERFISAARKEPPDIDVDFEHERREDVIQWVYEHYGRTRAALCATVLRYRARGAVRDVGKALGVPADVTGALAGQVWGWSEEGVTPEHGEALGLNMADRRLRLTLDLARELMGTPRHLGTHPGGFVLTREPLADLVPVVPAAMAGRQVIEWDKDDIDALKFMKVDLLGLGMLGCMRRAFVLLQQHHGIRHDLASIPTDCSATFDMICRADTLGTFQIESRAQMSMLPRLKPRELYDLVIQVAIVRPGPIQGDMVHPYLRRREGKEAVSYPTPELESVLGKTLGVPLFQEQAMRVAIVCAGFTPDEADQLRRAMATFKQTGGVSHFEQRLVEGMTGRGYDRAFAERMFGQIKGFGSYGFPESHAVSFALVAYASSWMKCHHPDVFCAALLNSQPMGFYAPAQVVRCARDHGVVVRPVDVNASEWDCTLEGSGRVRAVRLGLCMVKGLAEADGAAAAGARPYAGIADLWRRASVPVAALERLAEADAFGSLDLDRRAALWAIRALQAPLPLFARPASEEQRRPLFLPPPGGEGAPEGGGWGEPQTLPRTPGSAACASHHQGLGHPPTHPFGAPSPPGGGRKEDTTFNDPEQITEPPVVLDPMRPGREVVEDYGSTGLTLRSHPLAFLRTELLRQGMVTCAGLDTVRNGQRVVVAGLVLVRQKPGSAKGVMFITTEDETGIANLILWPQVFALHRRMVLSATMLACHGRVQRESGVTHVITERLTDLSGLLRTVGERDEPWPLVHGRGDGATHPGSPDRGEVGIRVPVRDFR